MWLGMKLQQICLKFHHHRPREIKLQTIFANIEAFRTTIQQTRDNTKEYPE
jgi:hypothetical protein